MSIYKDIAKFSGDYFSTMLNSASGGTTITTDSSTVADGVKYGSITVITNSTYDGTTGTVVLQGSNDNSTFQGVLQDDNTTAMSFTLATNSTYLWELKIVAFKFYRIVYTKGNATIGTVTANMRGVK